MPWIDGDDRALLGGGRDKGVGEGTGAVGADSTVSKIKLFGTGIVSSVGDEGVG